MAPSFDATFAARLADVEWHRSVDVDARLAAARALEVEAAEAGDAQTAMRARLVVGDMLHRRGDVVEGARIAREVHAWAALEGTPAFVARCHLVLSSMFDTIGDVAATLDHAVRAMDLLDDSTPPRERGNHLLRLADALAVAGSAGEARRRYREAGEVFAAIGDRERSLNVLNNLAMLEAETGEPAAALQAADQLDRAATADGEMNSDYADTIARARLVAGDLAAAEDAARLGLRLLAAQGDTKAAAPAELLITLAEVLLARGRLAEADDALCRASAVSAERHLAGYAVAALEVRSRWHAARHDYEAAYRVHRQFHAESVALRSERDEAAARTRDALFQASEARREAERFRTQARVDPLTDLPNRRHVDETLPRWLAEPTDCPLVVAIVDVDHFKRINDVFTHDTGDVVLRHLARLLRETMPDTPAHLGFVARLGGEEFLVADRSRSAAAVVDRLERLRADVAGHDWSSVAPGVQVTLSAGVTVAGSEDTQSSLLRRADEHLYTAKRTGRDRLVGDT